jgi:hypothetical protein
MSAFRPNPLHAFDLLLIREPHTPYRANVDTLVELLSEHISRYIYADGGARLEAALHAGTIAAGCSEARLARRTGRRRDIEAVATRCCGADCRGACEVPEPGARRRWESSCRSAGSEDGEDGCFGEHGVRCWGVGSRTVVLSVVGSCRC